MVVVLLHANMPAMADKRKDEKSVLECEKVMTARMQA
jgi:hypothetical protein